MRLIDADTLKRAFEKEFNLDNLFGVGMDYISIMQEINESPTIDAVQVVRCGECKYLAPGGICETFADDMIEPSASDYCSYGERRSDDAEHNEMGNVKMYAVVDGEYREVMEFQGEITLHECDEQLWQYDYVRVVRCKDCRYNYGNAEGREYNPNDIVCTYFDTDGMDESDYCSYGERRADES